ncbi:MAG: serine protease [Verrucomicrobiota bacterium]
MCYFNQKDALAFAEGAPILSAMSRPGTLLTALFAAVLSSCGTVHFPTVDDQAASFSAYQNDRIRGESIERFILRRTIPLLPSSGTTEMLLAIEKDGAGQWDPVSGSALATAISRDGYFLTADHVVGRFPPFHARAADDGLVISSGRTVKRFPSLDLAIIKFEGVGSRHFEVAPAPPGKGEILFSGGPSGIVVNDRGPRRFFAAGPVTRSRTFQSRGLSGWRTSIEIPNRPGSSGGPALDGEGRLCGIIVAGRYGRFAKREKPVTYSTMLDMNSIQKIISEDRAKQKTSPES